MSSPQKRINFIRDWTADRSVYPEALFDIEEQFLERLKKTGGLRFRPLPMPNIDDRDYHIILTFIIDALRFLPLRPDLAFDACWKALENVAAELTGQSKTTEALMSLARDHSGPLCKDDMALRHAATELFAAAPVQTWEDVSKNLIALLIEEFDENGKLKSKPQERAVARVIRFPDANNINQLEYLLLDLKRSHAPNGTLTAEGQRKCALFLRRLFRGTLDESKTSVRGAFDLSVNDKVHFMISGVMYTFRNQRFHGSRPTPFFTSAASMTTYAHAYFMFLCTYSFLLLVLNLQPRFALTPHDVSENILANVASLKLLFERHMDN